METVNIDKDEKNANWLHRKPVKKVVGKIKVSLFLHGETKKEVEKIIKRAGGVIDGNGVIRGCDIYTNMFTEMLELGALVSYCRATGALIISNWNNRVGSKGR